MKTNLKKTSKNSTLLFVLFFIGSLSFFSCSTELAVQKPLTFSDVEKEFKFAKPLSEQTKKIILNRYKTVENYRAQIISIKSDTVPQKTIKITGKASLKELMKDTAIVGVDEKYKSFLKKLNSDSINKKDNIKGNNAIKSTIGYNVFLRRYGLSTWIEGFVSSWDLDLLSDAEQHGYSLPYSCRAGACSSCCSKIQVGTVDCHEQSFYDEDQLNRCFFPLCVAYATSTVIIDTDMESQLN